MSDVHPTKRHLIETVVSMLDTHGASTITAESVLVASNVSKGSLYHHFEDFGDLIEAAQVARFSTFVANLIAKLNAVLEEFHDIESARAKFHEAVEYRESDSARLMRFERMATILEATHNERIAQKFAEVQNSVTKAWRDAYTKAIDRGWAEPSLDPLAVAVLMQSTIAGRIVDDISELKMEKDNWVKVIQYLLDVTFFAKAPKPSAI